MSETADPKETCGFCSRPVESGITIDDEFYHVHCAFYAMPRSICEELSRRADDITRLKSVIQSLVEAVTPFIGDGKYIDPAWHDEAMIDVEETVGDLRRALEAKTKAEEALRQEHQS